nr:hypothetical protein [Paenibacillus oryzisoli]
MNNLIEFPDSTGEDLILIGTIGLIKAIESFYKTFYDNRKQETSDITTWDR